MDKDTDPWHVDALDYYADAMGRLAGETFVDKLLGELRVLAWWAEDLTTEARETDNDETANAMREQVETLRARFMDLFAELDNRLTLGEVLPAEWRTFR